MRKLFSMIGILLLLTMPGCSKDPVDEPVEEATTFPVPAWKADDTGKYPATMTAVFALPADLAAASSTTDQLAAFANETCRGVGVTVEVGNRKLFFVLIQGLPDETNRITIRYYNGKSSYMYESNASFSFAADGILGTAENPQVLSVIQLK